MALCLDPEDVGLPTGADLRPPAGAAGWWPQGSTCPTLRGGFPAARERRRRDPGATEEQRPFGGWVITQDAAQGHHQPAVIQHLERPTSRMLGGEPVQGGQVAAQTPRGTGRLAHSRTSPVWACWSRFPLRYTRALASMSPAGTQGTAKTDEPPQMRRAAHTARSERTTRSSRRRMLWGLSVSSSWSSAVRSSTESASATALRMRRRLLSA